MLAGISQNQLWSFKIQQDKIFDFLIQIMVIVKQLSPLYKPYYMSAFEENIYPINTRLVCNYPSIMQDQSCCRSAESDGFQSIKR